MKSLSELLCHHAGRSPDATALAMRNGAATSYASLAAHVGSIGRSLRAAGIGAGDRVAVVMPEGDSQAAITLGTMSIAACAPINPAYDAGQLRPLLEMLRPAAVIVAPGDEQRASVARALKMRVIEIDGDLSSRGTATSMEPHSPGDVALLLFTSGTTARPKLVPLTHANLFSAATSIAEVLQLTSADRCLGVMPLYHIHGLSTLFASLVAGGSFVPLSPFAPEAFFDALKTLRPTWYSASPTIHRVVVDGRSQFSDDLRKSGLRFIRSASAPMPPALIDEAERVVGVPLIEAYGMTEASPQIASNGLPPAARVRGSVGFAAGPEVGVIDDAGVAHTRDAHGEIVIRGPGVMKGYLDDDEANRAAFVDGWLRTGDLGRLDSDGRLFVTGRLKEIINRGGEKISPRKIDDVLSQHPAVAQAVAFAVPHAVLGENVAAAIVLKEATSDRAVMIETLRAFAATKLAAFEVPHEIVFVDAIPLGPAGKVMRNTLAATLGLHATPGDRRDEPQTPTQRRIAAIFAEVLRATPSGINDDFFALGGHSLAATQVVARLRQVFGVALPPDTLFHQPTVAHLARTIGERLADHAAESDGTPQQMTVAQHGSSATAPLTFAQEQLYFVDQIGAGNAYNVSASLRLSGPLDPAILARSLETIVARHGPLRTTFEFDGEHPRQRVGPAQPVAIPLVDLTALDATTREEQLRVLANEHAATKFDLAAGPLMRASLVRLSNDDHVLLLHVHHIVFDGWSIGVLNDELAATYAALVQGHAPSLAPLSTQFADVAMKQRSPANDAEIGRQIGYWKEQLHGAPEACTFPTDHARPSVQTYRGATHSVAIDSSVVERVREFSRTEGVTPFMTYLAAFDTLLFRWNGQADCIVGAPIANRPLKEHEPLIGFFANTLVLRTSLDGDPTFSELLARVKTTALGAYAHQDVPLERIASEVRIARDASHTPLFQVMFAFQNLPHSGGDGSIPLSADLTARPYRVDNASAKFDITLYLHEVDGVLTATWQYNVDLHRASTIANIAEQYITLLEAGTVNPRVAVSKIVLLSPEQRRRIEVGWNRTQIHRVHRTSPLELFAAQVKLTPDAPAAIDARETVSYRELDRRASRIARRIKEIVTPETLVAVCLPRSADHIAALLGIWKAGGAFLPLDPHYPVQRTAFMLAESGAKVLLTTSALRSKLPGDLASLETLCVDQFIDDDRPDDVPFALPDADALAYVIYTSGTTGKPKGVMIAHGNVCHYAQAIVEALGVSSADRYLHTASFAFSSSVRQFTVPLSCGAAAVVVPEEKIRDPQALFAFARGQQATVIDLVPSLWTAAAQFVTPAEVRGSLRLALSASEPLPARVAAAWRDLFGPDVRQFNLFGQTETTGIVSTYEIPRDADPHAGAIVPIGRPIANTQFYVLDAYGNLLPPRMIGELHVAGAGVGRGYLGQAALTSERFIANPFARDTTSRLYRTGDLASYRDDGVLEIHGRGDGQIKIRGFRIEPAEIEAVATDFPGAVECAVVVVRVADQAGVISSPKLAAFVTPASVDVAALRIFLKSRLPDYMVPSTLYAIDALRRMPNGKLDRAAMAKDASQSPATSPPDARAVPAAPALADAQAILTEIWKAVLHRERVGADENFFDLGGNSLLSINIIVRAKEAGLSVTLAQLYQNQTIAELSAAIAAADTARSDQPAASQPLRARVQEDAILITADSLRAYGIEALTRAGLSAEGAAIVTEVQLEASLRGQPTHNVVSIPRYAKRLLSGKINARPTFSLDHETPFSVRVDGDNGPGQWVSTFAMDLAIAKARVHGIGMAAVRRSNHFGAAGQYVWQATQAGFIGLCTTNGPVILAPTGGVTPTFGNNPIGVGIPAGDRLPILLDIALSVAPRGRIGLAVAEGKPLPPGWILDHRGLPSTDLADLAAGLGVPIGGHKGYGLALVMEVLAGALTGAGFAADHHRDKLHSSTHAPDYGHFFMVIDPKLFMSPADFAARVGEMIRQAKGGPLAEGTGEILIPGEMELRARARSLEEGVRVRPSTLRTLLSYAKDAKLTTTLDVIDARCGCKPTARPNNETIPFDRAELDGTIDSRFKRIVAAVPQLPALSDGNVSFTYEELDRRSDQLAAAILAKVDPTQRCIAYLVDHGIDMVLCALAACRAGKASVCIHPRMPTAAQREILLATRPGLLITSGTRRTDADALASADCSILSLDDTDWNVTATLPAARVNAADPAVIFSTSGSTGRPKCVVKSHRAVLHRAWLSAQHDHVRPGDRQSLLTSCSFASSEADLFGGLLNGATVELFDVAANGLDAFATWIESRKITLLHPPVVLFRRLLKSLDTGARFGSVRLVALAGEVVTPGDVKLWSERFDAGCSLRHRFSSSEAGHIAVATIEAKHASDHITLPPVIAVPDKRLSIVDENGVAVPAGVEGELVVTSAFFSDGYWRDELATARAFSNSPDHPGERSFRTGDIGRLLDDGRFDFVGRRDNQVKIRGYRVELREIEAALLALPGVKEAVVIAEARGDENRLVAFVVGNGRTSNAAELRAPLEAKLPAWKVPGDFISIDAIPLTLTGKVDRQALLRHAEHRAATKSASTNGHIDTDPITAGLRAIWQRLLGVGAIRDDDAFADLGGHSLLAIQMTLEIKRDLGVEVSPSTLITAPTLGELASLLKGDRDRLKTIDHSPVVLLRPGDGRPPLICFPPLFGSPLTYNALARQLGDGQPVYALRIDDAAPKNDLGEFAAYFIQHVRTISPHGPYRLCGHSHGGVLAYEVARQLVAGGDEVELVALIDAVMPRARKALPAHRRFAIQLADFVNRGPRGMAREVLRPLRTGNWSSATPDNTPEVTKARQRMYRGSTLERYDGKVVLFRAEKAWAIDRFFEIPPLNGWDALCRQLEVRNIPGDHLSMMQPPNLALLARAFDEELKRLAVTR